MIWALAQIIDDKTTAIIPRKRRIVSPDPAYRLIRTCEGRFALVWHSRRWHAVPESLEISQNRSDQLLSSRILRAQTDSKEV